MEIFRLRSLNILGKDIFFSLCRLGPAFCYISISDQMQIDQYGCFLENKLPGFFPFQIAALKEVNKQIGRFMFAIWSPIDVMNRLAQK